jgi:hypothetical protein
MPGSPAAHHPRFLAVHRALAIAFFYAIGTGAGGITGPLLFSSLVSTGKVPGVGQVGQDGRAAGVPVNDEIKPNGL